MTQRRLTLLLVLFFMALAVPTSILVYQAYGQLKWEAFYQHQRLARELTLRIDGGFRDLIEREENRPISDYEFLNVTGSNDSAFLQRSPLSQFPLQAEVPGLLGYFQVDASGQLPDGTAFGDFREFRHLLAQDQNRLARTLATKLLIFGSGREMGFSDREEIERLVQQSAAQGYGIRDLLRLVITSDLFRTK